MKVEEVGVNSSQFARETVTGLAVAALEVSVAASFAFLVFAPLESAIPSAIGLTIVGTGCPISTYLARKWAVCQPF